MKHVVDAHCHPTSATDEEMQKIHSKMFVMSMHDQDQREVKELATKYPKKVVPFFGFHPWFTHFISLKKPCSKEEHYNSLFLPDSPTSQQQEEFDALYAALPEPIFLDDIIPSLRALLESHPTAHVGEVGLDKIFRVSHDYYVSPRTMTTFNIPMDHQIAVLSAQLDLAVELGRNVSMHSVRAQLQTVELLKWHAAKHKERWNRISIQMHSCGLSPQMWKDLERKMCNVFLSVSVLVNKRSSSYQELIKGCSDNRILSESDMNQADQCVALTCEMIRTVGEIKQWEVENDWVGDDEVEEPRWGVVRRLERNAQLFLAGNHMPKGTTQVRYRGPINFDDQDSDAAFTDDGAP